MVFDEIQLCIMNVQERKTIAQYIGQKGEAMAAEWLWLKGFNIVAQNYRMGRYEIDLLCKENAQWVFVEVKTRSGDLSALPESAVGYQKRSKLTRAAQRFMKEEGITVLPRLDIVAVSMNEGVARMMYHRGK
jgi:putative endonuclease